MLFLDGVGKPRGTTLILSSTLGAAGSVEETPRSVHAHTRKPPMSGSPAPDWKLEAGEKRNRGRRNEAKRGSGEKRKGVRGMNERGTGRRGMARNDGRN